ncbi:hypothetical protein [Rhodopseudomonas julia]|uniref:hypothetical protein n=1 Tax=Rhodopseudomonas julia TaxID=200617 RepID=UPI0027D891E2|nr:hypothetical protein [Rhodopseudomonas julia]
MSSNENPKAGSRGAVGAIFHSTHAFAAIDDHARLPWRFFARLFASDGSLTSA